MKNKSTITAVTVILVIAAVIFLVLKLITGAFRLASGAMNTILGIIIILVLLLIVIWMFIYAKKNKSGRRSPIN